MEVTEQGAAKEAGKDATITQDKPEEQGAVEVTGHDANAEEGVNAKNQDSAEVAAVCILVIS